MPERYLRFAELLEHHIGNVIRERHGSMLLNVDSLRAVRATIHETIAKVFNKSSHRLDPRSLDWLANRFFRSVKLEGGDGTVLLGEQITLSEYKLAELPFHDVQLLNNLFDQTIMGPELSAEMKRRTMS